MKHIFYKGYCDDCGACSDKSCACRHYPGRFCPGPKPYSRITAIQMRIRKELYDRLRR